MEVDFVCRRAHLRQLLKEHLDWSEQQLADAVGCSKSMVCKWKRRFASSDPADVTVLFSRSRAAHHHPPRIARSGCPTDRRNALGSSRPLETHPGSKSPALLSPPG
ncbi:MAG TPA: helix-turn-helix domain-containing protein [Ktedonosporobacter sp.]|nr:helix-turn-helix domain-containing protein [Ktedonosporobacter sp.]